MPQSISNLLVKPNNGQKNNQKINCKFVQHMNGNEFFNPVYNYGFNSQHQKCADYLYTPKIPHKYDYTTNYATYFEEWMSSKKLRIIIQNNKAPLLPKAAIDYWQYEVTTPANLKELQSCLDQDIKSGKNSTLWLISRFSGACSNIIKPKRRHFPLSQIDKSKYFVIDICEPKEFIYVDKCKEYEALTKFDLYPQIKHMYGVSYYNTSNIYLETHVLTQDNKNEIKVNIESSPNNQAWMFKIPGSGQARGLYLKNNKSTAFKFVNELNITNIFYTNGKILAQKVLHSPWLINGKYIGRIRPYILVLSIMPFKALVCQQLSIARAVKEVIKTSNSDELYFEWESLVVNLAGQKSYRANVPNDRSSMYILWDLKSFVITGEEEYDTPELLEYRTNKLKTNLYNTIKYHAAAMHFDMMSKSYKKSKHELNSNSMFVSEYCLDMAVDSKLNTYVFETNLGCSGRLKLQQSYLERGFYKIYIAHEYLFRKWYSKERKMYDLQINKPHGVYDEWVSKFGSWIVLFDQREDQMLTFN